MSRYRLVSAVLAACLIPVGAAHAAYTLTTLVTFDGTNLGAVPMAGLVADSGGNLYGTTSQGGTNNYGNVFKLTAGSHIFSTVATFNGSGANSNGSGPRSNLFIDTNGNLFGTTYTGGTNNDGTVFKIVPGPTPTLTTVANFTGYTTGSYPVGGAYVDASGNIYGTTSNGGSVGDGVAYKISSGTSTISVLTTFSGTNGHTADSSLVSDGKGNLWGTTYQGGSGSFNGNVIKITGSTVSSFASFNSTNGSMPYASVIFDSQGNLYGTTVGGGTNGKGTVFEILAGTSTITTLVNFSGSDGAQPYGGLIMDPYGNLFGTTRQGGDLSLNSGVGDGTVFEVLAGSHAATTLVQFNGTGNGNMPFSNLVMDIGGNIYGTTARGGTNDYGTVFELSPGDPPPLPEPASLSLLLLGAPALLLRRPTKTRNS